MVPEKQNLCPGSRSTVFLLPGTSFRGRRPHEGRRRDGSGACAGSAHRIEFSYEDNKLSRVESEEGSLEFEFKGDFLYSVTDNAGNMATFEQDRNGNLIQARSGELEREYTYDEHEDRKTGSNLTSVTDENGKLLLLAAYQPGIEVGSACQVAYIRTEDQTEKAFVYDPYDGVHTCLDPDGSSLVLTYETPVAESYTWTWYDAQGNILRQEVTSD